METRKGVNNVTSDVNKRRRRPATPSVMGNPRNKERSNSPISPKTSFSQKNGILSERTHKFQYYLR